MINRGMFMIAAVLAVLTGCSSVLKQSAPSPSSLVLRDPASEREIPVELYAPSRSHECVPAHPCPVALVSAGYGIEHTHYSFIADLLNELGYLVVAVQHDLPGDPPLARTGDLFQLRAPNWQQGARNLVATQQILSQSRPGYDWDSIILIGHSNGGDISAWAVKEMPELAAILITLDHRRVPLPRAATPRVLSIRAADFPADAGVLPDHGSIAPTSCVVRIENAKHDDMHDGGPTELKAKINNIIRKFLGGGHCAESTAGL